MNDLPDHPVIRNMERTGYPDGREPDQPRCPFCGAKCDTVYRNGENEIVGCEDCISFGDAWEAPECFPERD